MPIPGLKTYIGTKIIQATPQHKDYGPVEQQGQSGYTVVYPDGYTSWSPAAVFEAAYIEIGDVSKLEPYQQRVVGEAAELEDKLKKLKLFMGGKVFGTFLYEDRSRFIQQEAHMQGYLDVLRDRIAHF